MNRSLGERLQLIAPFLAYDKDPYLVVTGAGRLVYVQDAYTITNRFPNAETFDGDTLGQTSGLAGQSFNYMRNSVKVVMDAYDGSMTFYVADPADPLIRAWQGVFPTLFKPLATMPADIQAHLRVPEELFNVQTQTFARYHVTDPASFYQGDDLWTVPQNQANSATGQLPLEAYYVYMRMPGQPKPEFLLLQPMVPKARPNMIAWVAARNDAPNYGAVKVFRFPRDTSIFGPAQIEARIDQEPAISSQLTLWSQAGSTVVRGNLIVVPVQDLDHLPRADLPPVDRLGDPRVHQDRGGQPDEDRVGRHAERGAQRAAVRHGLHAVAQPDAGWTVAVAGRESHAGRIRHPGPERRPRGHAATGRRQGARRLREHALRARPGGAAGRRLRDLRRRDRKGPGDAPPARGRRGPEPDPRALTGSASRR